MKILSYNINGIRASSKLGLIEWLQDCDIDVVCLQEVRCSEELTNEILYSTSKQLSLFETPTPNLSNYFPIYNCGNVAGYAGTLILSKLKPTKIILGMEDFWTDNEGRTTTIIIDNLAIINTYVPNGNSRLDFKMKYLEALNKFIDKLKKSYKVICAGDFNISHNEIDLTNPKECKTKSVFLPIEREAFSNLLNLGLIDSFRFLNPNKIQYSWRSYRSRNDSSYNSWQYRIDYILIDERLKHNLQNSDILNLPYSDHLPALTGLNF